MNDLPSVDFQGGLGDCILRIYQSNTMRLIDEGERLNVLCFSSVSSIGELLYWHPHADKINLIDAFHLRQYMSKKKLVGLKLRKFIYEHYGLQHDKRRFKREDYYPPKWFHTKRIPEGPYAVVQFGAGNKDRSIPPEFYQRILLELSEFRKIYIAARDTHYNFDFSLPDNVQVLQWPTPAVLDLIRNCTLFVGAHSSLIQAAWLEDKPSICIYPDNHLDWHGPEDWHGLKYAWGGKKENTVNIDYSTFDEKGIPNLPHR